MKKFALVMGLVLAMGAGLFYSDVIAQSDPWWHPLNPQGGSHGVTYGTNLPTAANTGYEPTDGLLAVQITAGSAPTLNMYNGSTLAWETFVSSGGATGWPLLAPNGTAAAPSYSFTNDTDVGPYLIGAGNIGMSVGGALVMDWEDTNAAGAGADLVTISSTLGIMNGADTVRGLFVDLVNANHTGAGNTVYGIDVDGITADANADEYAIHTGAGWQTDIYFDGAETHTIYYSGGVALWIGDEGGNGRLQITDTGANVNVFRFESSQLPMDGADTQRVVFVDHLNADHTGAGNTLNLIDTDDIAGDANTDLNAINIGTLTGTAGAAGELEYAIHVEPGWDGAFYHEGIAHANLVATDNGSFVFCTDCDPASTPCTSAGAQTGAFAFRVNGQWDCPW